MDVLYVISGITGMTGNELVRQLLNQSENTVKIIGFDNFYASSIVCLVWVSLITSYI